MQEELLNVEEVARYLGVGPVTVQRWCREGRLPCIRLGKEWRIRRSSLDEFLRQGERRQSVVEYLNSYFEVPDHVIVVALDTDLLHRFDSSFFQIAESRGGTLVKFYMGESETPDQLRRELTRHGLETSRLEQEGRLQFRKELDPRRGRPNALRQLQSELRDKPRTIWASFDWVRSISFDDAVAQQRELRDLLSGSSMVAVTSVIEDVASDWPPPSQRIVRQLHFGMTWITDTHLALSRTHDLPPR